MRRTVLFALGLFLLNTLFYGNAQAPSKATVTLQPNWPQIFRGETITIRCEIQGGGGTQWTYEWKQDKLNKPSRSREYKINRATETDSGEYRCRGRRNQSSTDWSDAITLTVSAPTVTLQPNWPQIFRGERITITCEIQGGEGSRWTYEWEQDNSKKTQTSREYGINRATETDSGEYRCRGRRGQSSTDWSDAITLTVSAPTVTLQPNWPQIFRGERITIRCEIQGGEGSRWTYEWKQDNSKKPQTSREYWINTARETDSGEYRCRGTRDQSSTDWSDAIRLTVSAPTVTLQPNWPQIFRGERITLRCEIQGGEGSRWTYEWKQDKLNKPPPYTESTEYLQIYGATETDSGEYSCRGRRGSYSTDWSDAIRLTVSAPTVTLQPNWPQIYRGERITLRCEIQGGEGSRWTYEWKQDNSKKPQTSREYRINTATETDSGEYSCRGTRGQSSTYWSNVIRLTVSAPTVTLQPNWPQIFRGQAITVRCEIQGGEGSRWTYEWKPDKLNKPPTSREYRINRANETDSGEYRCRGRRGQSSTDWSDAITLTVSVKPVLSVSPSWLSPGASVTLSCELEHPSAGWRFYWYKAVPDLSTTYNYELLPGSINGTEQDSYIIDGQTHTAGYVCRAGRGDPVFYTGYSQPQFVWSGDVQNLSDFHSAASLSVNPDRVQHFTSDSVSLSCEGNSTEWRVRRFTDDGSLSHCSTWGTMTGSTCNVNRLGYSNAVYWCESGSAFSNAVNITGQSSSGIILVSPVHPVTEGEPVILGCKLKTQNILSNVFFYHNDKLIQNDTRGELNISAVSKTHEGFYKCQFSGKQSPQSWMAVTFTDSEPESSVPFIIWLVSGILLIILLLLLLLCCCRKITGPCSICPTQSLNINRGSATHHGDISVYEYVRGSGKTGSADVSVYESIRGSGNTGSGEPASVYINAASLHQLQNLNKRSENTKYKM